MIQSQSELPADSWSWSKVSRRGFLTAVGWGGFILFWANVFQSTGRFFFPNVLYEPIEHFKAAKPSQIPLPPDQAYAVDEDYKQSERVWLVRNQDGIFAFLALCRHLGCTPNWVASEHLFKCPCHGSNYDIEGDVVAGPAPRPLFRLAIKQLDDGRLIIDKDVRTDVPGIREKPPFFLPFKV